MEQQPPPTTPTKQFFNTWEEIGLKPELHRGIFGYGFENPSPIQQKAILPVLSGRDVIAQAQSGTGKTGTFVISSLQKIDVNMKSTQIVLLAPTHELASQIANVVKQIGSYMDGLQVKTLIGGQSAEQDIGELKSSQPHVVVGCPGRVFDMMKRGHLKTFHVKMLVIDEADDMLSTGFKEQVQNIFMYLMEDVQVCVFSATMPPEILQLTSKFMRDPIRITMEAEKLSLEGIRQYFVALENDDDKVAVIKDLFSKINVNQTIIYCNSVNRVTQLTNALKADGYAVGYIHRNMSRVDRDFQFQQFRKGETRVLISSNITARGIDIQQVSAVINYDVTKDVHTYLHRIGRSGRWGRKGVALNLITQRDIFIMRNLERYYRVEIQPLPDELDNIFV
jgi:translation initiation factor 4A